MGKLLATKISGVAPDFNAINSLEKKEEVKEQEVQKEVEKATKIEVKEQKPKKQAKTQKKEDLVMITLKTSAKFRAEVKMYCFDNKLSERELSIKVAEKLNDENYVSSLFQVNYDIDNKGKDKTARMSSFVPESIMREIIKITIKNSVSKADLMTYLIADEIKWKFTK